MTVSVSSLLLLVGYEPFGIVPDLNYSMDPSPVQDSVMMISFVLVTVK